MKQIIAFIVLLLILAALVLGGCSQQNDVTRPDWDRLIRIERYKDFDIYADIETGVEYFVEPNGYGGSMAPVLSPDGTPVLAPNFDAREDRP